jgi:hypothetical protein
MTEQEREREEIAAAREEIAEVREEIAEVREEIEGAVDSVLAVAAASFQAVPASETGARAIAQIIQNELSALGDKLSPYQQTVLSNLLRLHFSLRGPERLLESSGNFNRPVYPPIVSRR